MAKALSLVAYGDLESQVEALERDGYVYFPSVLNADEIAELRATMDRLEAIPESHDRDETPQNGDAFLHKLISNSFNRDPLYLQFLDRSPVFEVAEAAHGKDFHCIGMHSWLTGPGRPGSGVTYRLATNSFTGRSSFRSENQNPHLHHHRALLSQRYVRGVGTDEVCSG